MTSISWQRRHQFWPRRGGYPIFPGGTTYTNLMRHRCLLMRPQMIMRVACRRHQIGTITDETSPPSTDGEAAPDPTGDAPITRIGAAVSPQGLEGKLGPFLTNPNLSPPTIRKITQIEREGIRKEKRDTATDAAWSRNRIEEYGINLFREVASANIRTDGEKVGW